MPHRPVGGRPIHKYGAPMSEREENRMTEHGTGSTDFSYLVGQRIVNAFHDDHLYSAGVQYDEIPDEYGTVEEDTAFEGIVEQEVKDILRTDYKDLDGVWRDINDDLDTTLEDDRVRFRYDPIDAADEDELPIY